MAFERLVRFIPREGGKTALIGEPVDKTVDVGTAVREGQEVKVVVYSGDTVLNPGSPTSTVEIVDRLLSPLRTDEVGSIRCIGLNYRKHAEEVKMELPKVPQLFMKPATALADPWPVSTVIPKHTLADDCADYESELAVIIGKTAKNVSKEDAPKYILGYTGANDISSRKAQLEQSQACYSKGFDGSCPLGPVLVSSAVITDPSQLSIRGYKNGNKVQDSGINDLIFSVPELVSFLSQGTTLLPGTVIITGTPAGVGHGMTPKGYIHEGDEFRVEILPHIGSLYNVIENEK